MATPPKRINEVIYLSIYLIKILRYEGFYKLKKSKNNLNQLIMGHILIFLFFKCYQLS